LPRTLEKKEEGWVCENESQDIWYGLDSGVLVEADIGSWFGLG
jgi:hypothetical protein